MPTKSELRRFRDENGCKNIEEARMLWKLKHNSVQEEDEPDWVSQARTEKRGAHMLTVPPGFCIGALYMDKLGVPSNGGMVSFAAVNEARFQRAEAMKELGIRVVIMVPDTPQLPDLIVYEPKDKTVLNRIWEIEAVPVEIMNFMIWRNKIHPIYRGLTSMMKKIKWSGSIDWI